MNRFRAMKVEIKLASYLASSTQKTCVYSHTLIPMTLQSTGATRIPIGHTWRLNKSALAASLFTWSRRTKMLRFRIIECWLLEFTPFSPSLLRPKWPLSQAISRNQPVKGPYKMKKLSLTRLKQTSMFRKWIEPLITWRHHRLGSIRICLATENSCTITLPLGPTWHLTRTSR